MHVYIHTYINMHVYTHTFPIRRNETWRHMYVTEALLREGSWRQEILELMAI